MSSVLERYPSPLRYPGGKSTLSGFVKSVLKENELFDGNYVEPYAGGASLALSLLFGECVSNIYINDLDHGIYACWASVLREPEQMCALIRDTPVTIDEWQKQRNMYTRRGEGSRLALGFATFFLNRTNRSGIIESGGVIGGNKQEGEWRLDARYNKAGLVARVQRIARYVDRIHLSCQDALPFLHAVATKLPRKSLVYLDPPYYVKGTTRLYANDYHHNDHVRMACAIRALQCGWIVSYDNAPAIRKLYREYPSMHYGLRYTASMNQVGRELMFFSPGLKIPRGEFGGASLVGRPVFRSGARPN